MHPSEKVRITLGRKIKELRVLKNLSQEDLAEKTELNRSYISSLENGNKNVTLDILVKIALCLEVSLPELFEAPANLTKIDAENEYLKSLFVNTGFFSTITTLAPIPGLGLAGLALNSLNKSGKELLKKYIGSKKNNKRIKADAEEPSD